MPKRDAPAADQPLRETEETAWHAFREWPLLLVMRQKELALHQGRSQPPPTVPVLSKEREG